MGAEIVEGDLKHPHTLPDALDGVSAVISTASSTLSRGEGDSIRTVDDQGQRNAISEARNANVSQFVLMSFPHASLDFPLQDAKRAAERSLIESGMGYTILQPVHFAEVWFSSALGFDAQGRKARIFGSGDALMNWISMLDVSEACVRSLGNPRTMNQVCRMGGPDAFSQMDMVRAIEAAGGAPFEKEYLPIEALRAQHETSEDPLHKSFAALMWMVASQEWVFDSSEVWNKLGMQPVRVLPAASGSNPAV
jgi:NADH dehydrogenase